MCKRWIPGPYILWGVGVGMRIDLGLTKEHSVRYYALLPCSVVFDEGLFSSYMYMYLLVRSINCVPILEKGEP